MRNHQNQKPAVSQTFVVVTTVYGFLAWAMFLAVVIA